MEDSSLFQFQNRSVEIEIFNDISNGIINEYINLEDNHKCIDKSIYEVGKISNSICLKLLRGETNYGLILEKVLKNIVVLLDSEIGCITPMTKSPRYPNDPFVLICLDIGEENKRTICQITEKCQYENVDGVFSHSDCGGKIIISNDIENDPRSNKKLPEEHPKINKLLSIPMKYQHNIIGVLSVANKKLNYTPDSISCIIPLIDLCSFLLIKNLDTTETLVSRINSINKIDNSKDKFLATMSHELRTPLNGIMGMITLIPDIGPLNAKQKLYVKNLTECTIKLTSLLNNLLDFSKMSSDRLTLRKSPFSIKDAVDDSTKIIQGNMMSKGLELKLDIQEYINLPIMVGDRQRIVQILSNILSNAVKFTNKGFIKLSVESKLLSQKKLGTTSKWKITFNVEDTGIGVLEEDQDKIFEVFYQSSELSPFLSGAGTGLGLPISQELVRLMGGKINVKSNGVLNEGSIFSFYIILDEEISVPSILKKEDIEIFQGARVLIVDDRPEIRLQLSDILFRWKCIPIAVTSAEEALQYLQYGMEFKVAIVDINMPQMSGIELAQEVRRNYPKLPLIGISSIEIKGGENYFDFYMYKPVDQNALFPALVECVTKSRKEISETSNLSNNKKRKSKRKLKILVAEDEIYNRFTIKELLLNLGYLEKNITIVENGSECVKETKNNKYDVIFMDIVMPVMDGIEASKIIKRSRNPPMIIATSAAVQGSDKNKCQNVGIDGWLPKPIIRDNLESSLFPLIKRKTNKSHTRHEVKSKE